MKKSKTNKLFYNKWTHRVACRIVGGHRIKYNGLDTVRTWCLGTEAWDQYDRQMEWGFYRHRPFIDKDRLLLFANAVEPFLNNKEIKIRVEGSHFNLYCRDHKLFDSMVDRLEDWINEITCPETVEDYEFLLSNNSKKVLCDQLPHGKFKYKVLFKTSSDNASKNNINLFFENKDPRSYKIGRSTKRWLDGISFYVQDPFIYMTDDKNLSFLLLAAGNNIKRIDEFIVRN